MHNLSGTTDTLEKHGITTSSYNQGDSNIATGHNFFDCWRGKILTTLCGAASKTKTEISCTVTGALGSKSTKNEWFLIEMAGVFQGKLVLGNACFQTGICWRGRCLNAFRVGENWWISIFKYFPSNIKKKINFGAQNKVFFFHAFNKDTIKEHATAAREIWCELKPSSSYIAYRATGLVVRLYSYKKCQLIIWFSLYLFFFFKFSSH